MNTFWWNKFNLPSGNAIYLTPRPDRDWADINLFVKQEKPVVRFSFTDDYSAFQGINDYWYPWFPSNKPSIEGIWAFLNLILRFDTAQESPNNIWLHCDSSSMRAPTMLGLFLDLKYSDSENEIVSNKLLSGHRKVSCPIEYRNTEYRLNPLTKQLIDVWKSKGYNGAYDFVMDLKK